jgi:hypothetical protein
MKALVLIGSAAALALSSDYMEREGFIRFEFPVLILCRRRHDDDGVGERPHLALPRLELQSLAPTSSPRSTATMRARPRRG